jgi:hypothetical protein
LQGIRANDLGVSGDELTFSGGAFRFVTALNPLYQFGSDDLTVDPLRHVVDYRQLSATYVFRSRSIFGS